MATTDAKVTKERKPRGRPRTGRAKNLTLRLSSELQKYLKDVAAQNGRSLSKEVERRLTASLDVNADRVDVRALLHLVREVTERLELILGGRKWREDPYVFGALEGALAVLLSNLRPEGPAKLPDHLKRQIADLNARDLHFMDEWTDPALAGASFGLGVWQQMTISRHLEGEHSALRQIAEKLGLPASKRHKKAT